jgi:predicted O-methyltransferase YrrM
MMRQLARVVRVVRLRHLLKLVRHPRAEIAAFKYHYRRVPERSFVAFLAGIPPAAASLDRVYADLADHAALSARLRSALAVHPGGAGGQMTSEYSAIYALIRLLRPQHVVETGVADGATSAYILQALEDNGGGHLYSIDVPSERLPPGKQPGWIIDAALRHRWTLRIGPSDELLRPLLHELGSIDVFLHDSLHTYDNMLFEYRTAWPFLRTNGLFLSHDVGRNTAFFDFAREVGKRWGDWRVYEVLGGFRVTDPRDQSRVRRNAAQWSTSSARPVNQT